MKSTFFKLFPALILLIVMGFGCSKTEVQKKENESELKINQKNETESVAKNRSNEFEKKIICEKYLDSVNKKFREDIKDLPNAIPENPTICYSQTRNSCVSMTGYYEINTKIKYEFITDILTNDTINAFQYPIRSEDPIGYDRVDDAYTQALTGINCI